MVGGSVVIAIKVKVARCLNYVDAGIVIIDRWACVWSWEWCECFALSFGIWGGAGCWWWVVLGFIAGECNKYDQSDA